jgi:Dynein attachment factor N-terminus
LSEIVYVVSRSKLIEKVNNEMDKISEKEIKQLAEECFNKIKSDHLYQVRNDAKLRAVNNTKSYDEFKLGAEQTSSTSESTQFTRFSVFPPQRRRRRCSFEAADALRQGQPQNRPGQMEHVSPLRRALGRIRTAASMESIN